MPESIDPTTPGETEETEASAVVEGESTEVTETGTEGAESLGDAGKKALDAMKAKWKEERDRRKAAEARFAETESTPAGDDKTPDADAIRAQAERDANEKANARIIRSEIKAAATGKLADPSDAALYLDPKNFEVDENGDVDADEISEAIEELLTRKPHLAATARPRFQGSGDGGAARKAAGPTQLTKADLDRMSPEAISKAKREGRLNKILGITK